MNVSKEAKVAAERILLNQTSLTEASKIVQKAIEEALKNVYIVGYDETAKLVTTDKQEADSFAKEYKSLSPALPFAARTVEEALLHAYHAGQDSMTNDDSIDND